MKLTDNSIYSINEQRAFNILASDMIVIINPKTQKKDRRRRRYFSENFWDCEIKLDLMTEEKAIKLFKQANNLWHTLYYRQKRKAVRLACRIEKPLKKSGSNLQSDKLL